MLGVEHMLSRVLLDGDVQLADCTFALLARSVDVEAWIVARVFGRVLERCLTNYNRKSTDDAVSTTIAGLLVSELENMACGAGRWQHRRGPRVTHEALRSLDTAVAATAGSLDGQLDPVFESIMSKGWALFDAPVPQLDSVVSEDAFARRWECWYRFSPRGGEDAAAASFTPGIARCADRVHLPRDPQVRIQCPIDACGGHNERHA